MIICTYGPHITPVCTSGAASWWTLPHCLMLAAAVIVVFAVTFIWPGPLAWLWDHPLGLLTGRDTRMTRSDAARWKSARTMADLGELVIAWLNGEITQTPGHCGPPCDETYPLMPSLAILNSGGFVTESSQLAESIDGRTWNTWVCGFASDAALARLRAAVGGTPLELDACLGDRDCEYCPREECMSFWLDACPDAAGELRAAWWVYIEDPEPGRNDLLWPLLEKALTGSAP